MTNIDRWWPATPFFMKESLNLIESLNEVNNKYNQQIDKFFDKFTIYLLTFLYYSRTPPTLVGMVEVIKQKS